MNNPTIRAAQETLRLWAEERGIIQHSTSLAQALKLVSEVGELADNLIKGEDPTDSLGDVFVCLAILAELTETDLADAIRMAWDEIKSRKGRMVKGGAFVKEAQ